MIPTLPLNPDCAANEERLLLFAHGQLGILEQFALLIHLRRCSTCQQTLQGFQATSDALMASSALPGETGRRNAVTHGVGPTIGLRVFVVIVLVAIVLSGVFLGGKVVHRSAVPTVSRGAGGGCVPGLPNDTCR